MTEKVKNFLASHNFCLPNIDSLSAEIVADMKAGLAKKNGGSQPMIVASDKIPKNLPANESVIVIDAGGTNFRSCLVTFDQAGNHQISDLQKTVMPAVDKELSKNEFYEAIATNLEHLKNKAFKIAFCFSYAMEISKDGDGKVLNFSKEVKAPEVVGTYVGKELLTALQKKGWHSVQKIVLLNDTMAALLAGAASAEKGKKYSSFIGLILGTGLNAAYIEYEKIPKIQENAENVPHIIVCESALFDKVSQSDFDKTLDEKSVTPGKSLLEKQCSGAYLGTVAQNMILSACADKIFSASFKNAFAKTDVVTAFDIDSFLKAPFDDKTKLGSSVAAGTAEDAETLCVLLDVLYERSACIVTALLCACVKKSGKGALASEPVCITANGTMFWKGFRLYEKILSKMKSEVAEKNARYYEIVSVENDITLGTAIAGIMA